MARRLEEQTYDTSESSFSLGGLDVSATSGPKRFEWVKVNLDTGNGPEGAGDGRFYRTVPEVNGFLMVELGRFQGYDENGLLRSLNERRTWCAQSFVQCGKNRVQRTTGFLPRT